MSETWKGLEKKMLKIELLIGHILTKETAFGIRCTTRHIENKSSCDCVEVFPYLKKLTNKERKDLEIQLEYLINQTIKGVMGIIETIPYPKIAPPKETE